MRIIVLSIIAGILLSSCDWHPQTVVGTGDIESMEVPWVKSLLYIPDQV